MNLENKLDASFQICPPETGEEMAPHQASEHALRLLALRRSTPIDMLTEPGPSREALAELLRIAARVPDHRRVVPFRFIVISGAGRERAGAILVAALRELQPGPDDARIEIEAARFLRAPTIVVVVSSVDASHKTPEWEQVLTAGAVCQNLLMAASARGFAASWVTEWAAYDENVKSAFGLLANERIAGFIYIGSARGNPKERPRPDMARIVTEIS